MVSTGGCYTLPTLRDKKVCPRLREKVEEQIRENFPDVLAPIPTYDPMRPCPKCGKKKAATSWITDRLHRTCKRCGFGWVERPLGPENAEEAPAAQSED